MVFIEAEGLYLVPIEVYKSYLVDWTRLSLKT